MSLPRVMPSVISIIQRRQAFFSILSSRVSFVGLDPREHDKGKITVRKVRPLSSCQGNVKARTMRGGVVSYCSTIADVRGEVAYPAACSFDAQPPGPNPLRRKHRPTSPFSSLTSA